MKKTNTPYSSPILFIWFVENIYFCAFVVFSSKYKYSKINSNWGVIKVHKFLTNPYMLCDISNLVFLRRKKLSFVFLSAIT